MKLVYLVLAHHRPDLFSDLVRALDNDDALIFAHIDVKSDIQPFLRASHGLRVSFLPEDRRVRVNWGGWSQVRATLNLLEYASPAIGPDCYVVLLSGDSFPLQNPMGLNRFFEMEYPRQFISAAALPSKEFGKPLSRVTQLHLEFDRTDDRKHRVVKLINGLALHRPYRRSLSGRTPYGGSQWWALTGTAALWVLDESLKDKRFVRFAKHTLVPDELFIQTMVANSSYGDGMAHSLMFADWSGAGNSPADLTQDHVDALVENGMKIPMPDGTRTVMFARKIVTTEVPDAVRRRLWPLSPGAAPSDQPRPGR